MKIQAELELSDLFWVYSVASQKTKYLYIYFIFKVI